MLPIAAAALRADVLHAPANVGPGRSRVPVALTVHDLIPADAGDAAWGERVRRSVRAARAVMTPTAFTRDELVRAFGTDSGKVTVTPWAPIGQLARVTDAAELARARAAHGLAPHERYVFGYGAADPRKNTARLVRAYVALPDRLRAEYRLLLVGIQSPALAEFRRLAESLGVADRVILEGFADEGDLPALLSGAACVAFPSQSEGFGLPLLDAFACGAAVLAGDRTSLPEVAGGAALLCDPTSDDAVRDGLARLLTDEGLRAELAARGTGRAGEFDWGRTAELVAGALERAATRG